MGIGCRFHECAPAGGIRADVRAPSQRLRARRGSLRVLDARAPISWRRDGVAVGVTGPHGDPQTLRARAAIVTLPVGVLRHRGDDAEISFEPELPAAKREALVHVEMGHVVKVALWFRSRFGNGSRAGATMTRPSSTAMGSRSRRTGRSCPYAAS